MYIYKQFYFRSTGLSIERSPLNANTVPSVA